MLGIFLVGTAAAAGLYLSADDSTALQQTAINSDQQTPSKTSQTVQSAQTDNKEAESTYPEVDKVVYNTDLGVFKCKPSCFLAAVDKQHSLPESYQPEVQVIASYGSSRLVKDAADALLELIDFLEAEGVKVELTSSYRSFANQQSTFNRWVKIFMERDGLSQAEARIKANTFSARPGHSEHQLGTTVDINTVGAEPFNIDDNRLLYGLLEKYAYRYGFVISYPEAKEDLTGYVHEPWHIRYLGIDLATKIYKTAYLDPSSTMFSTKYLRDYGFSD